MDTISPLPEAGVDSGRPLPELECPPLLVSVEGLEVVLADVGLEEVVPDS